ncbi:MAG: zinc-ribbon domain-containing protein [Myxococcota bacterium]
MKISCPACSAKYSIADDKVQDRLAKIRCRKCGATIVIDGKTTPPHVYTGSGDAPDVAESADSGTTEYSVDFGEGDQRTLSLRDLVTAYNAGQVTGETFVWAEGFADWKPLADVTEIVSALNAGPAAASASPWEQKAAAKPAVSAVPRSAARSGGRSATADLFGSIDTAGSEDDVATSAPEQPSPIGTPSNASATGARNESSVLFSLSALTSAAQPSRASGRAGANGSASRDDSGLIDLKALTAAAMKTEATGAPPAAAPAMPLVAPVSPLGVAPPLGLASPAFAPFPGSADISMPQPKSKAPIIIGVALGVGMLAIAAAILLKPEPPPPPPAPVIVQAPPAPPPAAPTPAPEAVAKPPATGTGETAPEKTPPKVVHRSGGTRKPSTSSGSGAATPPAESKPAAPAPKKNPCGCASGDLQCAMRCAAKGG